MQFFASALLVLFVIVAILMLLLVFIQDDQGEGMGGIFSGGSGTPFGSRSGNVLKKMTTTLAVLFFSTALLFGYVSRAKDNTGVLNQLDNVQGEQKWWDNSLQQDEETPEGDNLEAEATAEITNEQGADTPVSVENSAIEAEAVEADGQ